MKIVNQGRVDVEYVIDKSLPIVRDTRLSNRVATDILEGRLIIKKEASKKTVGALEIYKYKIYILNVSMLSVHHIELMDNIPANIHIVLNSTKINGKKTRGPWVKEGMCIGTLSPQECCEIEFSAYALLIQADYYVCNCAKVQYDYLYQIDKKPIKFLQTSNAVITKVENRLVQSMTTQATLCVPEIIRNGGNLEQWGAKVICINAKAIHTTHGSFVLVVGVIRYHLCLSYFDMIRKSLHYVEGFSTIIKVPDTILYISPISCSADIKGCSAFKPNRNSVSVSTALILSIKGP